MLDKQSLSESGEVDQSKITIKHVSEVAHIGEHDLLLVVKEFKSAEDVEQWCDEACEGLNFNLKLTSRAKSNLQEMYHRNDRTLINSLIEKLTAIRKDPHIRIGQLESLTGNLSGYLSMRLNQNDRLVYKVDSLSNCLEVKQLLGHYDDK